MSEDAEPRSSDDVRAAFEAHSIEQQKRLAALPFHEKLKWLEEAHRLVLQMQGKTFDDLKPK